MGMGMTEKQGGSDVRANSTRAEFEADDAWGKRFRITGHKWFMSAPMCDAFLVLAQTATGPELLLPAAAAARRQRQRAAHPAAEAQAGQPGQRQLRSGVRRRHRLAGGRRRPRRAADPGDGHDHAAGLRAGHRRADAPGAVARAAPHGAAQGLRQAPGRAADDEERARRPGAGKRGRHRAGACAWRARSTAPRTARMRTKR